MPPSGPGVAYLAGEARTCQAVRAHSTRRHLITARSVRLGMTASWCGRVTMAC
jgi:hypothetical protein